MSIHPRPVQTLEYGIDTSSVVPRFMNQVYAWMCAGLALTAVIAFMVAADPNLVRSLFSGGTFAVLVLVELGLVLVLSAAIHKLSPGVATALFLLYAALNGVTLSVIFLLYTLPSVGATFIVTAGMFGATSLYGFVTRRDLSAWGGILLMALIGLILASLVNLFWASSTLYWLTTYAGVIIFVGLTAYDTQRLKEIAYSTQGDPAMASRMAVYGSLVLYLDFINLFLYLLRLFGKRR